MDENFGMPVVEAPVDAAPAVVEPAPVVADPAPAVAPVADLVNSPAHYTAGQIEVIDFIESVIKHYPPEVGYHAGNAVKYLSRAPLKGNLKQDLAKAKWYIERALSKLS